MFDLFRSLASRVLAGDDLRDFLELVDAHQAADAGKGDATPPLDVPANAEQIDGGTEPAAGGLRGQVTTSDAAATTAAPTTPAEPAPPAGLGAAPVSGRSPLDVDAGDAQAELDAARARIAELEAAAAEREQAAAPAGSAEVPAGSDGAGAPILP